MSQYCSPSDTAPGFPPPRSNIQFYQSWRYLVSFRQSRVFAETNKTQASGNTSGYSLCLFNCPQTIFQELQPAEPISDPESPNGETYTQFSMANQDVFKKGEIEGKVILVPVR